MMPLGVLFVVMYSMLNMISNYDHIFTQEEKTRVCTNDTGNAILSSKEGEFQQFQRYATHELCTTTKILQKKSRRVKKKTNKNNS